MVASKVSNHTKEISMGVIPTGAPNADGYQKRAILTNFSRVTDVSRIITFPDRRFPDKTFPGQSFSRTDVSRIDVSRTICINNIEYFGMFM